MYPVPLPSRLFISQLSIHFRKEERSRRGQPREIQSAFRRSLASKLRAVLSEAEAHGDFVTEPLPAPDLSRLTSRVNYTSPWPWPQQSSKSLRGNLRASKARSARLKLVQHLPTNQYRYTLKTRRVSYGLFKRVGGNATWNTRFTNYQVAFDLTASSETIVCSIRNLPTFILLFRRALWSCSIFFFCDKVGKFPNCRDCREKFQEIYFYKVLDHYFFQIIELDFWIC